MSLEQQREEVFGRLYGLLYESMSFLNLPRDVNFIPNWVKFHQIVEPFDSLFPYVSSKDKNELEIALQQEIRLFWKYSKNKIEAATGRKIFIPEFLTAIKEGDAHIDPYLDKDCFLDCDWHLNILRHASNENTFFGDVTDEDAEFMCAIVYGLTLSNQLGMALYALDNLANIPNLREKVGVRPVEVIASSLIPALANSVHVEYLAQAENCAAAFAYYLNRGDIEASTCNIERLLAQHRSRPSNAILHKKENLSDLVEETFRKTAEKYESAIFRDVSGKQRDLAEKAVRKAVPFPMNDDVIHALVAGEIVWQYLEHDNARHLSDLSMGIVEYAKATEGTISALWEKWINKHRLQLDEDGALWTRIQGLKEQKCWKELCSKCDNKNVRRSEIFSQFLGCGENKNKSWKPSALEKFKMIRDFIRFNKDDLCHGMPQQLNDVENNGDMNALFRELRNGYAHESVILEPSDAYVKTKRARELSYALINRLFSAAEIIEASSY